MKKVLRGEQNFGGMSIATIELNNPKVLNSLDTEMLKTIEKAYREIQNNSSIAALFLHSNTSQFFCAGGNVKGLTVELQKEGLEPVLEFFTQEYLTDYFTYQFKKPIVAWLDGIVMGGGLGLTMGSRHRIVTEKTVAAMPEVFIGLFPDVGGSWFLSRPESGLGLYLGLTGLKWSGALGHHLGFFDYYIDSKAKRQIQADLVRLDWSAQADENHLILKEYFNSLATQQPAFSTDDNLIFEKFNPIQKELNLAFFNKDYEKVIELSNSTLNDNRKRCFLSQVLFLKLIEKNKASNDSVQAALENEWLAAVGMSERSEFVEGVRAVLIEKDHSPQWSTLTYQEASDICDQILNSSRNHRLKSALDLIRRELGLLT